MTAATTPSAIAKLLAGLNAAFSDPSNAGTVGLAQGLLQAAAPHMLTPVTMGQALGMGAASSQAYQHAALANALQRTAALPFAQARTREFVQALDGQGNGSGSPLPTGSQIGSLG